MKTEDEILAQLRASQNINLQNIPLPREPGPPIPPPPKDDVFPPNAGMTPNLEELQKLIREEALKEPTSTIEASTDSQEHQVNYMKYILSRLSLPSFHHVLHFLHILSLPSLTPSRRLVYTYFLPKSYCWTSH